MDELQKFPGPRLVPLLDGSLVFNDSEPYRHLCEARWLAAMPQHDRLAILFDLENSRGPELTDQLRRTIDEVIAVTAQQI